MNIKYVNSQITGTIYVKSNTDIRISDERKRLCGQALRAA